MCLVLIGINSVMEQLEADRWWLLITVLCLIYIFINESDT